MALLIRCKACKGMKNIMGMGMVTKKCGTCDGIGYIKEEPKVVVVPPQEDKIEEAISKLQAKIMDDKEEVKNGRKETQKKKGTS